MIGWGCEWACFAAGSFARFGSFWGGLWIRTEVVVGVDVAEFDSGDFSGNYG